MTVIKNYRVGQYDYDGLVDYWLLQTEEYKSTAGNRMHFKKNKMYSYSTIISEIREDDKLGKYIILEKYNYSRTTQKQKNIILWATNLPIVNMYFDMSEKENIKQYEDEIKDQIKKIGKTRLEHTKKYQINKLRNIFYKYENYIKYMSPETNMPTNLIFVISTLIRK